MVPSTCLILSSSLPHSSHASILWLAFYSFSLIFSSSLSSLFLYSFSFFTTLSAGTLKSPAEDSEFGGIEARRFGDCGAENDRDGEEIGGSGTGRGTYSEMPSCILVTGNICWFMVCIFIILMKSAYLSP